MSFRGSGGRGGSRGNRGGGGRSGGFDQGPLSEVIEVGQFAHMCENDLVCSITCGKIPYFNAVIYTQNKEQLGKIDEIFGDVKENGFTVKLSEGIKPHRFNVDDKLYIDPGKLLPLERFLNENPPQRGGRGRGSGVGNRGGRGAGGGFRGRGAPRGGGGSFRGSGGGFRGGRPGGGVHKRSGNGGDKPYGGKRGKFY